MSPVRVGRIAKRPIVRALARGLDTLKALGSVGSDGASLSDVAAIAKLDRATTRRSLLTLVELGYARANGKRFVLAPKVLELGFSYFSSMPVWERVQPILNDYSEKSRGAFSIGVLDDGEVVYVARAQSRRAVYSINVSVGSRFPAYCSSIGRVLLAGLHDAQVASVLKSIDLVKRTPHTRIKIKEIMADIAEVRAKGYSISDQETELGVSSIAVPIFDRSGSVIAGLNTSAPASLASAASLRREYLPLLRQAAEQCQAAMQILV